MKKVKEYIKSNLKVLPLLLIFSVFNVSAASLINSNNIAYNDNGNVSTVKEALDTLYSSVDVATITPVGAILPYMGTTAPTNYLICDGSTYNISDYKKLADHIKDDFGSYNFFGGDGETTFAVPDLRGEFLRGSGTNSHTNQGSGASVGEHQDGTIFADHLRENKGIYIRTSGNSEGNSEKDFSFGSTSWVGVQGSIGSYSDSNSGLFTSRPTNTSVNYIIKVK